MPQRFLRPGITNSDAWNSVSFGAQSFYVRLLTLVDDYGRYDGRIQILHSHCFALRSDVTVKHSAAFRSELESSGLVLVYQVDGKDYVQITKWQERARGPSKYPEPPTSAGIRSGTQPNPASLALAIVPSHRHEPSPLVGGQDAASLADIQSVFDEWNSSAKKSGLPQCLIISDKRRSCLSSRFKDDFFKANWRQAISRISKSQFCHGHSDRGWRATFDWFITPDAVLKVMEGKYDSAPKQPSNKPPATGGY